MLKDVDSQEKKTTEKLSNLYIVCYGFDLLLHLLFLLYFVVVVYFHINGYTID